MKRIISVFLCIAAVCLFLFTGCESNDDANNTIMIDGTEFVICFSENGVPGIMYCETSRNTAAFGENNMILFSNETLIEYFN